MVYLMKFIEYEGLREDNSWNAMKSNIAIITGLGPMIAPLLSDEDRRVNGQRIEVSGRVAL